MLLTCNPKCRKSDGTTDASLDVERNEAVCNKCGEDILNISAFTKQSMKNNKDIITATKKAFMFDCKNCNKKVETVIINGAPYGKNCATKNCTIQISEVMTNAIEKFAKPDQTELE